MEYILRLPPCKGNLNAEIFKKCFFPWFVSVFILEFFSGPPAGRRSSIHHWTMFCMEEFTQEAFRERCSFCWWTLRKKGKKSGISNGLSGYQNSFFFPNISAGFFHQCLNRKRSAVTEVTIFRSLVLLLATETSEAKIGNKLRFL